MIDGVRVRRSLLAAGVLLAVAGVAAAILGQPLPVAAGLLLGFALGALPFASWTWTAARGFAGCRARVLAVVLQAGKLGLYGGVLFLLVTRPVVSPVAVMIGITVTSFIVVAGALLAPAAPKAKEAA